MSAPGGFYPKVDVPNFGFQGPFYPKECSLAGNAVARRDYGDVPGFGLMWAYFDLHASGAATFFPVCWRATTTWIIGWIFRSRSTRT